MVLSFPLFLFLSFPFLFLFLVCSKRELSCTEKICNYNLHVAIEKRYKNNNNNKKDNKQKQQTNTHNNKQH